LNEDDWLCMVRHLLALAGLHHFVDVSMIMFYVGYCLLNEDDWLCMVRHLLALAGIHHFVDVSRIRFNGGIVC
jgi:hypothetical protein